MDEPRNQFEPKYSERKRQMGFHQVFKDEVTELFSVESKGKFSLENMTIEYEGFDERMENFQFGIYLADLVYTDLNGQQKTLKIILTKGTPGVNLNHVTGKIGRSELEVIQKNKERYNIEFSIADLLDMELNTELIDHTEIEAALSIFDPKISTLKFQAIAMNPKIPINPVKAIKAIIFLVAQAGTLGRSAKVLEKFREQTFIASNLKDTVIGMLRRLELEEA